MANEAIFGSRNDGYLGFVSGVYIGGLGDSLRSERRVRDDVYYSGHFSPHVPCSKKVGDRRDGFWDRGSRCWPRLL